MIDKPYFTDFWTVPGYLGANPPASLLNGRIQQGSKLKTIIPEEQAIKLGLMQSSLPGEAHGSADAAWKALGEKDALTTTYTFARPGTYFPTLRVASQRQGDAKTPYARIQNLGRVRVVVK